MPHPNDCELFLVNRETLFSYHKSTEKFLYNLMSLFVSSHYKNSPNDLQLLSDAPAHAIFVLLGPISQDKEKADIPDILCAVQVSIEGKISKKVIEENALRGIKPSGDLIPWIISEQYQDNDFPQLKGVRVVRIATHVNAQKMGYGSKVLELLDKFFEGKLVGLDENTELVPFENFDINKDNVVDDKESKSLLEETMKPKKKLKPLLKKLSEVQPPQTDYLGVSFGLTQELYNFWKKNGYHPVYIRQVVNELTGEHTCIMIRPLETSLSFKANISAVNHENSSIISLLL